MHALTIDLEDWHQLVHRRVTGVSIPPSKAVVTDTYRVLDLLEEAGCHATFFIVGGVAATYPQLVREVARRGHEIGSHTFSHELVSRVTPAAFRADVERSRGQLQDLTGQPVLGFRAPEFSVGSLTHWCFEILVEAGFRYDSSVFPLAGARYGVRGASQQMFTIDTATGPLTEFPLATWDVGPLRLPVAGGSYFRLLPAGLLSRALYDLDANGQCVVLYFHPYEFHRGWLYLTDLSWRARLRASNLKPTLLHNFRSNLIPQRLQVFLKRFRFRSLGDIWSQAATGSRVPVPDQRVPAYSTKEHGLP